MHIEIWSETLKRREILEDIPIDEKINIRMDIAETGREFVDWMHLAHDEDQR
jgi:hypothetical protein